MAKPAQLTVGTHAPASFLMESLTLPVLDDLEAVPFVYDCLVHAVVKRKGVVVAGVKGTGKSMAVAEAVDKFNDEERETQRQDASYIRRELLVVENLRVETARDVYRELYVAADGREMAERAHGKRKSDAAMRRELVALLVQHHVAAVVIDEAECLGDGALLGLRDIMSVSETRATGRRVRSKDGTRYAAAGVGVLLSGTPPVAWAVRKSDEAGRRWVRIQEVGVVPAAEVARTYRRLYEPFERHAKKIGDAKWAALVAKVVGKDKALPISLIENHVQDYHLRAVASTPGVRRVKDVPFVEPIFTYAFDQVRLAEPKTGIDRAADDAAADA